MVVRLCHESVQACPPSHDRKPLLSEVLRRSSSSAHVPACLEAGNLERAVKLPISEDHDEWLATHTVEFFSQVSLLYDTLTQFCTPERCPVMSAGPRWTHGLQVSAPEYMEYFFKWAENQIGQNSIFPHEDGAPFPHKFRRMMKPIFMRLFHAYAHIYCAHLQHIIVLEMEAHLNTCFKHFILFVQEFSLIGKKELAALQDLVNIFLKC